MELAMRIVLWLQRYRQEETSLTNLQRALVAEFGCSKATAYRQLAHAINALAIPVVQEDRFKSSRVIRVKEGRGVALQRIFVKNALAAGRFAQ